MIDGKDLRPLTAVDFPNGIKANYHYYRKEADGTYSHCIWFVEELSNYPQTLEWVKKETAKYIAEGRLFTRRSKPGQHFGV